MTVSPSTRLTGNILAMISMLLWASGFPATEELFETWHPLLTTVGRLIIGGLVLLPLMLLPVNRPAMDQVPWKKVIFIGSTGLGFSTVCLNVGIMYSNAVTAAILVTMMPPVAFLLALLNGEVRMSARWVAGISLAVAGGIWAGAIGTQGSLGSQGGEWLIGLAVLSFAWYSRAVIQHLGMLSIIASTTLTLLVGGVITTVAILLHAYAGFTDLHYDLSPRPVGLLVWVSAIANGFAMVFWLNAASRIGVTLSAFHQNMVPFYVMVIAVLWGGSVIPQQILAAIVVVGGVLVTQWPTRAG